MKKLLLVINPQSGKTQIKAKLLDAVDILIKAGYRVEVYVTQCAMDAKRVVSERGVEQDVIVCSGGDGTLNEVINGLMALENPPVLGYLPSGSTNDFAASQGIPTELLAAVRAVVERECTRVDVGCFNGRYFTYVAAFGLLTEVPYVTPRETKALLGYQAYLLEGAKRLGKLEKHHLRVTVDDQFYEGNVLIGMVSNASRIAGIKGLNGKKTKFDDGKFEVLLIEYSANLLKLTETVTELVTPEIPAKYVHRFEGSHIRFEFDDPTDWVLDGEFGGSLTEVVVDVAKQALQVIK
ncbi:MAG: YegS/Rv2252/BmrU family lipid kinase [Lachnospiraceae bacterium]|nr:YegS/Rv2252/BmrU family lipid kinase [Lachnospiraceae bacterium]